MKHIRFEVVERVSWPEMPPLSRHCGGKKKSRKMALIGTNSEKQYGHRTSMGRLLERRKNTRSSMTKMIGTGRFKARHGRKETKNQRGKGYQRSKRKGETRKKMKVIRFDEFSQHLESRVSHHSIKFVRKQLQRTLTLWRKKKLLPNLRKWRTQARCITLYVRLRTVLHLQRIYRGKKGRQRGRKRKRWMKARLIQAWIRGCKGRERARERVAYLTEVAVRFLYSFFFFFYLSFFYSFIYIYIYFPFHTYSFPLFFPFPCFSLSFFLNKGALRYCYYSYH